MPIPLKYQRYFTYSHANPGEYVTVITKVYFTSPFYPDINTWFTDIGDNLGGSSATLGPLNNLTRILKTKNLWTSAAITPGLSFVGNGGNTGCMRVWSRGNTPYPMGTGWAEQFFWRPTNPNTYSELELEAKDLVSANASGTIIIEPTTFVTPSATNFTPACVMATVGTGFSLQFDYSIPAGASLTLTIN